MATKVNEFVVTPFVVLYVVSNNLFTRYQYTVGAGLPPVDVHVNVTELPSSINVGPEIIGISGAIKNTIYQYVDIILKDENIYILHRQNFLT